MFPMWLPTRVYESLPCAYVVGGLLFLGGAIYLGPGASVSLLYQALGVTSILSGILVFVKRWRVRRQDSRAAIDAPSE